MLKKILIIVAVLIVGFLILVAVQPGDFRVSRSTVIAAPVDAMFPQVNELKKWEAWSPWGKLDPAMKQTYEGPPAGKGATSSWAGNSQVGEGRMTITESRPNELVQFKLEFFKPMAGVCDTTFTFKPSAGQTEVTWTMSGKNNYVAKAMCLFVSMDKMVGGQFEQGLATMKSLVEADAKK
jgi:hypothetical protein